ncbi:hypothetical protein ACOSP7_030586 [Xanthoceras sorbifolium]
MFKLNVDAACDKSNGRVDLGMVMRNEGGDVVLAAAIAFKEGTDVSVVEAQAVLEGLMLASSRGFTHLLVECDCLDVINICNDSGIILSDIGNIVSDVRIALGCFNVVSISHVPRLNNFVAHGIAK